MNNLCVLSGTGSAESICLPVCAGLYRHLTLSQCAYRPDRLAQAIPQWQVHNSGYIGVMRAGTEAHDMTYSPWYEPLGVLHNNKYYMYASGGMYALSAKAAQLLTQTPFSERRLAGGGEDASMGLWVLGYNIQYLDDRRLGVYYDEVTCPANFIGKPLTHLANAIMLFCQKALIPHVSTQHCPQNLLQSCSLFSTPYTAQNAFIIQSFLACKCDLGGFV